MQGFAVFSPNIHREKLLGQQSRGTKINTDNVRLSTNRFLRHEQTAAA